MAASRLALLLFVTSLIVVPALADEPTAAAKTATAREVLAKTDTDLLKALESAQKQVPDGKPLAVRVEKDAGKARFGAYFLAEDKIKEVEIDATSGDMLKSKEMEGSRDTMLSQAKKAVADAKVSLPQAIKISMDQVKGGKAFEAEFRLESGKPVVEVELLVDEKPVSVHVDALDPKTVRIKERKKD
jgi:uncharacterized membrane protein YkoI